MWTSIFLQPAAQTIPSVPIPQTSPMTFALQKGCSSLQNFCSGRTHAFSAFHWLVFVLSYEIFRIFFALKIPYCLQSLSRLVLYEKGTFLEKFHLFNVSYCKILESQDVLLCGFFRNIEKIQRPRSPRFYIMDDEVARWGFSGSIPEH